MSDCLFNLVLLKKGWMKLFFGKRIVKKRFESVQVTPSRGKIPPPYYWKCATFPNRRFKKTI